MGGTVLSVEIPGREPLRAEHLLLDLNGTLATDGCVPQEVLDRLQALASILRVHVLTADTFGTAACLRGLADVDVQVVGPGDQVEAKAAVVRMLGPSQTIAIGNGLIDEAMLREAALGILVIGREGAAVRALLASDLVTTSIQDALDLLRYPRRLAASLRTG
jgi:soluble P-type ATPase